MLPIRDTSHIRIKPALGLTSFTYIAANLKPRWQESTQTYHHAVACNLIWETAC